MPNEHQIRQKQIQDASRQFLRALSAGQVGAKDRFGNTIEGGQRLLYKTPHDLIFDVVTVNPVLDPRVPPGSMDITLSVTFPLRVAVNTANPNAIVVTQAQPKTDNAAIQPAGEAPAEEPTPAGDDAFVPETDPGLPVDPRGPRLVLTDPDA